MKMKKGKISYEDVLIKECIPKRNEIIPMIKSILDNNNIPYEINAQGRMESWYRVTPNYVMLHLVYRFNKNPKRL